MNLDTRNFQAVEPDQVLGANGQTQILPGPRIERCEFEQLLQRAMEILNLRDLKARLKEAA